MIAINMQLMNLAMARRGGGLSPAPSVVAFGRYDPSDLTTLFQDAAMTTPVTADGDPVGAMADKSGNGRHMLQSTGTFRPIYKTSGGLHWLKFDGVDDYLTTSFTTSVTTMGVAMAARVTSTAHFNSPLYSGANNLGATSRDYWNRATTAGEFRNEFRNSGMGIGQGVASSVDLLDEDHVYTDILSTTGVQGRRDGETTFTATGTVTFGADFSISLFSSSTHTRFAGGRFYGGALIDDAAQITAVESWLAGRGGISL